MSISIAEQKGCWGSKWHLLPRKTLSGHLGIHPSPVPAMSWEILVQEWAYSNDFLRPLPWRSIQVRHKEGLPHAKDDLGTSYAFTHLIISTSLGGCTITPILLIRKLRHSKTVTFISPRRPKSYSVWNINRSLWLARPLSSKILCHFQGGKC